MGKAEGEDLESLVTSQVRTHSISPLIAALPSDQQICPTAIQLRKGKEKRWVYLRCRSVGSHCCSIFTIVLPC